MISPRSLRHFVSSYWKLTKLASIHLITWLWIKLRLASSKRLALNLPWPGSTNGRRPKLAAICAARFKLRTGALTPSLSSEPFLSDT